MAATSPASGVPFWTDLLPNPDPQSFRVDPDAWSIVYAGPGLKALPGILDNGGIKWTKHPHRLLQKNKSPSADGENPVYLGFGCSEFDLDMVIWTRQQLTTLNAFLPYIWAGKTSPRTGATSNSIPVAPGNGIPGATGTLGLNLTQVTTGGAPTLYYVTDAPMQIQHPELTMASIDKCLVLGFTPPRRWQGKNDVKMYSFHCREFRPSVSKHSVTPKQVKTPPINPGVLPVAGPGTPPSQTATPTPTL
jgi:hypothetical protein